MTIVTAEPSVIPLVREAIHVGRPEDEFLAENELRVRSAADGRMDGASIGIGIEPVNLRVAFVGGTVLPLDLEKEVLHFPQRTAVYGGGEFFDNARDLWLASVQAAAKQTARCALWRDTGASPRWMLRDCGCSIELLQPDCIRRLRVPQRVHLRSDSAAEQR